MKRSSPPQRSSLPRRLSSWLTCLGLAVATLTAWAPPAGATGCDPGADTCVVTPDSVQTPLGLVSVSVSATNTVTVQLDPLSANTLVIGVPFAVPAWIFAGCAADHARTTVDTAGGLVTIDTVLIPPGPPCLPGPANLSLPNLAVISIHPPGPCRVSTVGATVVFTPRASARSGQ